MANTWLDQAIVTIYNTGFFDYALPFMVTFAILYGILEKTNFLGKENKKVNPILSLIISLMILPFVSRVDYITYLSKMVFIIVKFVAFAMILGLFGYSFKGEHHQKYALFFGILLGLLIVVTEFFDITSFRTLSSNFIYLLLIIIIFGIVYWFISGKPSDVRQIPLPEKKRQPEPMPEEEEEQVVPVKLSDLRKLQEELQRNRP